MPKKISLPTLCIDFDGVICDQDELITGAKPAIEALVNHGYRVIIHTIRARTKQGRAKVMMWLDVRDVPYHDVTAFKEPAMAYIDDRAIHFDDWTQAMAEIGKLSPFEV